MLAEQLPSSVLAPLTQMLNWLAWFVLLVSISRAVWIGGQLAIRMYREEAVEGLIASLVAAALSGSASGLAIAIIPT